MDLSAERRYQPFAAYDGDRLVGLLRASFDSDFTGNDAFAGFDLPAGPHGFVSTINVHPTYRRQGIGRALLLEYARAAEAAGCTFLGGVIDLSTDDTGRRVFFTECGFHTNAWDNFGQTTGQLLTALTPGGDRD